MDERRRANAAQRKEGRAKLPGLDVSSRKFDSPEGFAGQVTSMERDPCFTTLSPHPPLLLLLPPPSPSHPGNRAFPESPFAPLRASSRYRSRPVCFPASTRRRLPSSLHPPPFLPVRDPQTLSRESIARLGSLSGPDVCTHLPLRIYAPPLADTSSLLENIVAIRFGDAKSDVRKRVPSRSFSLSLYFSVHRRCPRSSTRSFIYRLLEPFGVYSCIVKILHSIFSGKSFRVFKF